MVLFQQAVERKPTPRALGQLGLCEHSLGMWLDADAHLEEALRSAKDPWIVKNTATLRGDLARVQNHLGSIEIWGTPDGAAVSIDGRQRGTLPLPAPLRAIEGPRVVTIEASGFVPEVRTIQLQAGDVLREHVTLSAKRVAKVEPALVPMLKTDPEVAPPDPAAPPVAIVGTTPTSNSAAGAAADGDDPFYKRWWFWTAVGVVAVGTGVSVFLLTRKSNSCPAGAGTTTCVTW